MQVKQRFSLMDHISSDHVDSGRDNLAGLTLNADKRHATATATPSSQVNRTLLDIIRDEDPGSVPYGHRKSWKAFRDKLRLKRTGSAWTSSVHIPSSDIPIKSPFNRRNSVRFTATTSDNNSSLDESLSTDPPTNSRLQMTRRTSSRYTSPITTDSNESSENTNTNSVSFRPQMSRHNSTRYPISNSDSTQSGEDEYDQGNDAARHIPGAFVEERRLSAREAVAAQEAAEAAAMRNQAEEEEYYESEAEEPVKMSLMDLLEENDREMGISDSAYRMGEEEEFDDEEEEEDEDSDGSGGGAVEYNCCVCMVRHRGAAFIPCGHTFCRLCSRELFAQRGNCPLCNRFILEILDIF